jgi:hypothetical protein
VAGAVCHQLGDDRPVARVVFRRDGELQLLVSRLARRWGRERTLIGGTALAGIADLIAGVAGACRC